MRNLEINFQCGTIDFHDVQVNSFTAASRAEISDNKAQDNRRVSEVSHMHVIVLFRVTLGTVAHIEQWWEFLDVEDYNFFLFVEEIKKN